MERIRVRTEKELQVLDITHEIEDAIDGVQDGVITAYVPHTTAAITIQEPDKHLWTDLLDTYKKLVPLKGKYRHNAKYSGMSGEQNAHAHILSSMIKPSVQIPIEDGILALGTWQSVLFIELDGGRERKVMVQAISR